MAEQQQDKAPLGPQRFLLIALVVLVVTFALLVASAFSSPSRAPS